MNFKCMKYAMAVGFVAFICLGGVTVAQDSAAMKSEIRQAIENDTSSQTLQAGIKDGKVSAGQISAVINTLTKEKKLTAASLDKFLKTLAGICTKDQFTAFATAILKGVDTAVSQGVLTAADQTRVVNAFTRSAKVVGLTDAQISAVLKSGQSTTKVVVSNAHNKKLWDKRIKGKTHIVETIGDEGGVGSDGDGGISKK